MKLLQKISYTVKREEILQLMFMLFLALGCATTAAVLVAPLQMSEVQAVNYYANPMCIWFDWLFILVPTIGIPLITGICHTAYRMWRPSSEEELSVVYPV